MMKKESKVKECKAVALSDEQLEQAVGGRTGKVFDSLAGLTTGDVGSVFCFEGITYVMTSSTAVDSEGRRCAIYKGEGSNNILLIPAY